MQILPIEIYDPHKQSLQFFSKLDIVMENINESDFGTFSDKSCVLFRSGQSVGMKSILKVISTLLPCRV